MAGMSFGFAYKYFQRVSYFEPLNRLSLVFSSIGLKNNAKSEGYLLQKHINQN